MLGLLPVVVVLVTAAGVRDFVAGTQLLDQRAADHPAIRKDWADGGCRTHFTGHAATLGTDLKIVQRTPGTRGFTPIPKRWTAERTYGRLMLNRRLARDAETRPHRSEPVIHLAMSDLMAHRLTGASTLSWRTPVKPHPSQIPGGNNE
jgi:transposase